MLNQLVAAYNEAVYDTDRDAAFAVVQRALDGGVTPEQVVFDVVLPAIEQMMGGIAEDFNSNLAQHFMTAQIASEVTEAMVGRFAVKPEVLGRVIIGTSRGDLHTLGKRIVTGCLKTYLVEVHDLGVNVAPERFVEAAIEKGASVIAISSMMVHTARSEEGCVAVRRLLADAGLEERIRLVVGGAPYRFDPQLYRKLGADAWAADGVTASKVISKLIVEVTPWTMA